MHRLPPSARRMALGFTVILGLLVFPALFLSQLVRTGRSPRLQMLHAEGIAAAVRGGISAEVLASASSSTEVFNTLLRSGKLQERQFYVPGFAPLKRRGNGDEVLSAEENGFALLTGLSGEAGGGYPVLLWDPGMLGDPRVRHLPLSPRRWLGVDSRGKARFHKGAVPGWWERGTRGEDDVLPGVPGKQRLLRP